MLCKFFNNFKLIFSKKETGSEKIENKNIKGNNTVISGNSNSNINSSGIQIVTKDFDSSRFYEDVDKKNNLIKNSEEKK